MGTAPTFFFSERSFHMRASSRVSSLSDSSGRSSCSCFRFSSEKMNMAEMGRLGFSELACGGEQAVTAGVSPRRDPQPLPTPGPIAAAAALTLPVSGEDFLDAGLVAPFRLLPSIFSSPSTRCCSSSGRLWVARDRGHGETAPR